MEPELRARESAFGPQSHGEPAHGPTDGAESAFGMRDVGHRSPQDGRPLMQVCLACVACVVTGRRLTVNCPEAGGRLPAVAPQPPV